jgi:hypothetical protein
VLALTQHRRLLNYLSLPPIVAMVLLVIAKLIALERADIIAELGDRVAHGDSPDASAAVRQLAAMPRAPVSILVSAATSGDREVAEEAKHCIGRLLRRVQRQIEAGGRARPVARQLAELAESLAAQRTMFSPADDRWLASTTRKVLRLAHRIPPRHTPVVAVHCDAILSGIALPDLPAGDLADNDVGIGEPVRPAHLQSEVPVASSAAPQDIAAEPAHLSERLDPNVSPGLSTEELLGAPWRTSWSHPIFRMAPALPINAAPVGAGSRAAPDGESYPPELRAPTQSPPVGETPPTEPQAPEPPMAEVESRELLRRWLSAEGSEVLPLEEELTRRGFGRLSARLVEQLFSADWNDRLALVDGVLTEPGVDARPWLMLLSDDANADVRLLAVTIMATSNDAVLVEKAWQVSIRDHDSRIAALAGRLRERRNAQRR